MADWTAHLHTRLAPLQLSESREQEIIEELSQHLDLRYEDLRADGATETEAYRLALEELCEPETLAQHMQALRQSHVPSPVTIATPTGFLLTDLWQDLRHAARMLRKQRGFSAAAVLTLALGIGAATAIFSLINAGLLRPLPFRESNRIAVIWDVNSGGRVGLPLLPPANADVAAWRHHTESFASIAAFLPGTVDHAGGGDPERVGATSVTAGFFETLGVTPMLGRTLAADEEGFNRPPVALISYGLWQRRYGGDAALVGQGLSINGTRYTVIGILPPDFDFPRGAEWPAFFPFAGRTDIWLPLPFRARDDGSGWSHWESRNERSLVVIGRLKPGTSLRQAQAEMDAFATREALDHPDTHKDARLRVVPLRNQMAEHSYRSLLILFGAGVVLLLIACVNVANLVIARGVARQQEMAVRVALGAKRGRLIRAVLTECLLLAALASVTGLLVARACLTAFLVLNPLSQSRLDEASLDLAALGFAALSALVTTVVFGLVPALHTSRLDPRQSLLDSHRGGDGAIRQGVRSWLVSAEVALALTLLTTAGLMVQSFIRVQAVDPGFNSDSVLAFDLQVPGSRYPTEASQVMFFQQLTESLERLPRVRAAGAISYLPLGGGENMGGFVVEGEPPVQPGNEPRAERRWVTPGYFAAMSIPVRRGRVFTPRDMADQPRVVVVNETMASQFFSSGDPLGRRMRVGGAWRTIVGVVADVKSSSLESIVRPQVYLPHAQWPWAGMTVVVNTDGDAGTLVSAARSELKAIDAQVPPANMRTMEQVVSKAASSRRFNMALLVFFAVAALALTAIGIYGVGAFLVSRRRREIGIRITLGAQSIDVVRLVLQQALKPVAIGAIVGLLGSLAASRIVANQLYGVSGSDPLTLAGISALLGVAALLACWLPAYRATKVHPTETLRSA